MKLKHVKTAIFVIIFVVLAGGSIYNYMKPAAKAPEIIKFFDVVNTAGIDSGTYTVTVPGNSGDHESSTGASEDISTDGRININTAGAEELDRLPGIGPVKAKAIIDYRNAYGSFVSIEEIIEVKGIGPATYQKIKDLITIE